MILQLLLLLNAYGSRQDDSLHVVVDGVSSTAERASALLSIAATHAKLQPGESLAQVKTALSFAEQTGDQRLLLRAIRQERDLEYASGAFDQFLQSAIRALGISERLGDGRSMADDMRSLSTAYDRIGAFDKAVEASKQALFLLKTTGDSAAIGKGVLDLMNALVRAGRFNEMLHQSDEALAYYNSKSDSIGAANVWMRQGEALIAQKRYSDSRPMLLQAERVFRYNHDRDALTRTLIDLAEANVPLGRWDAARLRVDEAMDLLREDGSLNSDPQVFDLLGRIEEGEGHITEALRWQRRRSDLRDSLFTERMAERMAGLQALYQDNRKDHEFESLRVRNLANEDTINRASARGKWWMLVILILLIAAVGGFVLLRSQRRLVRRARLRTQVIQRQTDEITTKNLELERQNLRLAESLVNEEEKDVQHFPPFRIFVLI